MHSCPKYKPNPGTEKLCGKELTYHRIKICRLCSKLSLGKILLRSALDVCSSHRSVTTLLESKKIAEEWQGQTLTGRVPQNHVRSSGTGRNLVRNM